MKKVSLCLYMAILILASDAMAQHKSATQDVVAQAHLRYEELHKAAARARQNMLNLKPVVPELVEDDLKEVKAQANKMTFTLKPGYFAWPQTGSFRQAQDYIVTMSYLYSDHVDRFEKQTQKWTQKGWFV
jgi:hypothetical protein